MHRSRDASKQTPRITTASKVPIQVRYLTIQRHSGITAHDPTSHQRRGTARVGKNPALGVENRGRGEEPSGRQGRVACLVAWA